MVMNDHEFDTFPLGKIPKFGLIFWCEKFLHSFGRIIGNSVEIV